MQYSVSGLRPLTNYTIRVTVHNGVSDQDPGGEQRRWCEVSGVTGDIRKLGGGGGGGGGGLKEL